MNKLIFVPFISLLIFAIDYYVWQAVKTATLQSSPGLQNGVKWAYWGFTSLVLLGIWGYNFLPLNVWKNEVRITFMALVMISVISKLFIVLFLLIEDITRILRWAFKGVKMRISSDDYARPRWRWGRDRRQPLLLALFRERMIIGSNRFP